MRRLVTSIAVVAGIIVGFTGCSEKPKCSNPEAVKLAQEYGALQLMNMAFIPDVDTAKKLQEENCMPPKTESDKETCNILSKLIMAYTVPIQPEAVMTTSENENQVQCEAVFRFEKGKAPIKVKYKVTKTDDGNLYAEAHDFEVMN